MGQDVKRESRVSQAVRALAELSLEHADGAFIGAEDELLARLGVSRPTLRQAAKIAEHDGLVSVRRGAGGGVYAARPEATDAIRTLTRYLRLQGATLQDLVVVDRSISEEAAALAAHCQDAALRARLDRFSAAIGAHDTPGALIRAETELARLIAEMSGNTAIALFVAISYAFGLEDHGAALFRSSAEREQACNLQRELCRAILNGDAEIARLIMRRRAATVSRALAGGEARGA